LTIEEYLKSLEPFVDDAYGRQIRSQFQTIDGKSELAMLSSPSRDEYAQLARAVAIMTGDEKNEAASLTDEQVERIAEDAKVDKALLAIFFNGFALKRKNG
jgi:preprotein translocase subunit Sss1